MFSEFGVYVAFTFTYDWPDFDQQRLWELFVAAVSSDCVEMHQYVRTAASPRPSHCKNLNVILMTITWLIFFYNNVVRAPWWQCRHSCHVHRKFAPTCRFCPHIMMNVPLTDKDLPSFPWGENDVKSFFVKRRQNFTSVLALAGRGARGMVSSGSGPLARCGSSASSVAAPRNGNAEYLTA